MAILAILASMENFNLPFIILLGFLIIWSLMYWIFPLVLMRLREPRKIEDQHQPSFLAETGTVHRLGRDSESDRRL
jgi:hypothetical protein